MDPELNEFPFPFEYMCPITQNLMNDPVITVDGHTFDRQVIQQWFNKGHITNPLTNKPLSSIQLIPNRCLKSLICSFKEKASGLQLNHVNQYKVKNLVFNINQQLSKKFPHLVDSFGMVKLYKLEQIIKQNELLKKQNGKLLAQIKKERAENEKQKNQLKFRFPQLYQNGHFDMKALEKILKEEKSQHQQNLELAEQLKLIEQQLSAQQQQKNLLMSLMNASYSEGVSLKIEERWYDEAAVAMSEVMVPPATMLIHITESMFEQNKNTQLI